MISRKRDSTNVHKPSTSAIVRYIMEAKQTYRRPLKKTHTTPKSASYQDTKRATSKGPLRKRPLRKKVTFSQYSEQLVFCTRSLFRARNCYSKCDIQLMKSQVLKEACRIYEVICTRYPQQRTGTAVQSMLRLGLLQYEEILGIEHLLTPELVQGNVNGRRSHKAVITRAQDILRKKAVSSEVAMIKLAKVARVSSSKQVNKAVCRAGMSLQAEGVDFESIATVNTCLRCAEPHIVVNGGVKTATKLNSRAAIVNGRNKYASKVVARAA